VPSTTPKPSLKVSGVSSTTPRPSLKLRGVSVRRKRFKRGQAQAVRFTLSAPATVTLVFTHNRERRIVRRTFPTEGSYNVRVKGFGLGKWRLMLTADTAPPVVKRFQGDPALRSIRRATVIPRPPRTAGEERKTPA
jgi:hypothetical protein